MHGGQRDVTHLRSTESVETRLATLHERVRSAVPGIDRLAVVLSDHVDDRYRASLESTWGPTGAQARHRRDHGPTAAVFGAGPDRDPFTVTDLRSPAGAAGAVTYRSAHTVQLAERDRFVGELCFESTEPDTFGPEVLRQLEVYADLIALVVLHELIVLQSVIGAVRIAHRFTELRDIETGAHLARMARYSQIIAAGIASGRGHDDAWVDRVHLYSPLHDVGKIGVPDEILLKPGPLDPAEWHVMMSHTVIGGRLIDAIVDELGITTAADEAMMHNIVELHHEHLDGSGYPHGFRGDEIPDEARAVAVADVYDALTTRRPYKEAWSAERALVQLEQLAAAGKLDRSCVAALIDAGDEVEVVRTTYAEPD